MQLRIISAKHTPNHNNLNSEFEASTENDRLIGPSDFIGNTGLV